MKARIPLPNDLKSAVKTEIAAEWKKIQKRKILGNGSAVFESLHLCVKQRLRIWQEAIDRFL